MQRCGILAAGAGGALLLGGFLAFGQARPAPAEQERKVAETEVSAAALQALRRLAGKAPIREFAEEIEHGHRFYEGSWTGPDGNVDALVTESGDLVEIEEIIPAERVPAAVRAATEREAGRDARMTFEKKTLVMYEVHYRKGDRGREMILTPDGRRYHEAGAGNGRGDEDGDDEDEDEDEDDDED